MQFFFSICEAPDGEPFVASEDNIEEWVEEARRIDANFLGNRLRPIEDATLIRRRGGELLVTDGPFAEGKELISGYDVMECRDWDEAIELASRHPMARWGQIEIRAIWPWNPDDEA